MAIVRPLFGVHPSSFKPVCPLSLLICIPLGLASMFWRKVSEGHICIPTLCLKYLVICIANALLATGWLLVSILSVLSEVLPSVSEAPPTLPRMPSRRGTRSEGENRPRPAQESLEMRTGAEWSYERETRGEIITSRTVVEIVQTVKRSDSHRVHFAGEESGPVASTSRTPITLPPETPERRPVELPSEPQVSSPDSITHPPLPSPPFSSGSNDSAAIPRGRRLSFIRRRFADKHARNVTSPKDTLLTPPSSAATSPARSPERMEQPLLQRASTTYGVKCKQRKSAEVGSPKPIPRTDPYQAPYFFPSPLSPEANGYVGKVRSERVAGSSPEARSKSMPVAGAGSSSAPSSQLPTPAASPQRDTHLDLTLESAPSANASPTSAEDSALPGGRAQKRRSWRVSLTHQSRQSLDRPASWTSEAPTVASSSGESHASSPKARLSGLLRRNGSSQLAPLSPLESTVGIDDVPHPKHKRTWHLFHSRSSSEAPHPASPNSLPVTAGRPKIQRS